LKTQIVYRIRRKSDGKWSRGGMDAAYNDRHWTDDPWKAKIWKRKSDLNSHLTLTVQQCQRRLKHSGRDDFPTDWQVVPFTVSVTAQPAVDIDDTYKYVENDNVR
jgi:hypothetical protein